MWELHYNYPPKLVPCVYLYFLIFLSSELMMRNTKNLILMNYKISKKTKQLQTLNKNHHMFLKR